MTDIEPRCSPTENVSIATDDENDRPNVIRSFDPNISSFSTLPEEQIKNDEVKTQVIIEQIYGRDYDRILRKQEIDLSNLLEMHEMSVDS